MGWEGSNKRETPAFSIAGNGKIVAGGQQDLTNGSRRWEMGGGVTTPLGGNRKKTRGDSARRNICM